MKNIIEKYKEFIKGNEDDEDWIYDMTYEFFNNLDRGELCEIMDFILKNGDKYKKIEEKAKKLTDKFYMIKEIYHLKETDVFYLRFYDNDEIECIITKDSDGLFYLVDILNNNIVYEELENGVETLDEIKKILTNDVYDEILTGVIPKQTHYQNKSLVNGIDGTTNEK